MHYCSDICLSTYVFHIYDFDLFPSCQAKRDPSDPENAIIGTFAGNLEFNYYISYATIGPNSIFQHSVLF